MNFLVEWIDIYFPGLQAAGFPPQQFSVRYPTIPFITVTMA
jgi:hypothetical protein